MRLAICIPTYNEKENIVGIISEIFKFVPDAHIIVADDNSPDGTAHYASQISGNVTVLLRKADKGFANSYKDAFSYALSSGADLILQMDADFSHNPMYIQKMLEAIETADFVVGSRYIKGGGVTNWPLLRRLVSQGGNVYAWSFLGKAIRDLTGGFNLWRRSTLERLPVMDFTSDGYNFQIELKVTAQRLGFKPKEVPILFTDRIQSISKMSSNIVFEAFLKVPLLAFKRSFVAGQPFSVNPKTELLRRYASVVNN